MRILLIAFLFIIAYNAKAQYHPPKETDRYAMDIEKNIFRLILTGLVPNDIGLPLTFSYEREIRKPFTTVLKAGPYFSRKAAEYDYEADGYSMNGYASAELRYYINLMRRIRKQKPVRNFSAYYFSVEQMFLSKPLIVLNQSSNEGQEGRQGTYLNIGYQKQFNQGYFNVFCGPRLNVNGLFKEGLVEFPDFHVGIAIGAVLFE